MKDIIGPWSIDKYYNKKLVLKKHFNNLDEIGEYMTNNKTIVDYLTIEETNKGYTSYISFDDYIKTIK